MCVCVCLRVCVSVCIECMHVRGILIGVGEGALVLRFLVHCRCSLRLRLSASCSTPCPCWTAQTHTCTEASQNEHAGSKRLTSSGEARLPGHPCCSRCDDLPILCAHCTHRQVIAAGCPPLKRSLRGHNPYQHPAPRTVDHGEQSTIQCAIQH